MADKEIEILIKGHDKSSMNSLTADLVRKLLEANAEVMIDPTCSNAGLFNTARAGKTFTSLKDVTVTVKNERVARKGLGGSFRRVYGDDVVQFTNGDEYDIHTDKLIPLVKVLEITQLSRYMLQRRIDEGTFPQAHFAFGPNARRWVERLVVDFVAMEQASKPEAISLV